jgi:FkbM family methyltransferase
MFGVIRYRYRAWKYSRKDHAEIAFLRESLRPGDFAIDIGAHKGGYLYWARHAVGTAGRVLAFEPQPKLAEYLRETVRAMDWSNVDVEWAGVSSTDGEMNLAVPVTRKGVSPGASLEPGKARSEPCELVPVKVHSLDSYIGSHATGKPVRFIKCDVEGHELDVFHGAENLIRGDRPILMFECEQRHHFSGSMTRVFEFLSAMGMRGRFFAPDGELRSIAEFNVETHQRIGLDPYCNNFVFEFPDDSTP